MLSQKRISGLAVVRDSEMCWLPTRFHVTRFAVAPIFPTRKLPAMLILVAFQTVLERDMRFEILGLMTVLARYRRVPAKQRIVRTAMIEPVIWKNLFPTSRAVAARTICAEGIAVRILVARRAVVEEHEALVLHGTSR